MWDESAIHNVYISITKLSKKNEKNDKQFQLCRTFCNFRLRPMQNTFKSCWNNTALLDPTIWCWWIAPTGKSIYFKLNNYSEVFKQQFQNLIYSLTINNNLVRLHLLSECVCVLLNWREICALTFEFWEYSVWDLSLYTMNYSCLGGIMTQKYDMHLSLMSLVISECN